VARSPAHEYFGESARGAGSFMGSQGRFQSSLGTVGRGAGKGAMVAAAVLGGVGLSNFLAQPAYAAEGTRLYVPVAADLDGANGSVWKTGLVGRVVAGGDASLTVTGHPRGQPMSAADPSGTIMVDGSIRLDAPLAAIGASGAAWLDVQSDSPIQLDTVYVYNQSADGTQQGQAVPVFDAATVSSEQRFAHDGDSITFELPGPEDGKRANALFFTPPESGAVRLELVRVDSEDTEYFLRNVWLEGGMYTQVDRLADGAFDGDALRVHVRRNGHNENVFVYGALSVVDNVVASSQDPVSKEGTIDRLVSDLSLSVAPGAVEQDGVAYARIDVATDNTVKNVRVDWEGDGVYDTNTVVNAAGPYTGTITADTSTPGEFNPVVRAVVVGNDGLDKVVNADGTSFTVTEAAPEATIIGLDYDGDGVADNVDSDGDGVLDETIQMECESGYQHSLVSENAAGDYTVTSAPTGMAVSVDGVVDYNPSCADVGTVQSPTFARDGATMQADYQINNTPPPQIIGIDMDGDGAADVVDANGDNILDSVIDVSCSFPIAYEHQLITDVVSGTSNFRDNPDVRPQGMGVNPGTGLIGYNPPCSDSGQTFTPQFQVITVGGTSDWMTIQYRVND
jgi:hypothetical protein